MCRHPKGSVGDKTLPEGVEEGCIFVETYGTVETAEEGDSSLLQRYSHDIRFIWAIVPQRISSPFFSETDSLELAVSDANHITSWNPCMTKGLANLRG